MPARTTRQAARQRMIDTFMSSLGKVIPGDESEPLKGRTFLDWEKQAEQLKRWTASRCSGGAKRWDQPWCGSETPRSCVTVKDSGRSLRPMRRNYW